MMDKKAVDLVKLFEGCKLSAYRCPAGVLTIGYGHTRDVMQGDVITQYTAEKLLLEDLQSVEDQVNQLVTVPLTTSQRGALVSFAYNGGITNLKQSTLLKRINERDPLAADEFLKWNKATVKGEKVVLDGLTRRRKAERNLFLS
jgi:lysozyme